MNPPRNLEHETKSDRVRDEGNALVRDGLFYEDACQLPPAISWHAITLQSSSLDGPCIGESAVLALSTGSACPERWRSSGRMWSGVRETLYSSCPGCQASTSLKLKRGWILGRDGSVLSIVFFLFKAWTNENEGMNEKRGGVWERTNDTILCCKAHGVHVRVKGYSHTQCTTRSNYSITSRKKE